MKISIRILLINFIIVVLVFVSSTIAFYSLTGKIVSSQQTKNLLNSEKDFVYVLQSVMQDMDDEFLKFIKANRLNNSPGLQDSRIDFIISANSDSTADPAVFLIKSPLLVNARLNTIERILRVYPNSVVKKYRAENGTTLYFGEIISEQVLTDISKRIRADVSLLINNSPLITSNSSLNQKYLAEITQASKELSNSSVDLAKKELDKSDLYAICYDPAELSVIAPELKFLIFSTLPEAAELRENINNLLVIIGFTGVTLSLILSLIFTEKIRKQITHLSEAAEITRGGNLEHRVSMLTKDELGSLGSAFNSMLDEIEKNQNAKNEYTEFISLINQNPSVNEISEAALEKIINATGYNVGRIFLAEGNELRLVSSYGIKNELEVPASRIDLYQRVIEKGETVQFQFESDFPKINTGLMSLEIKQFLIFPVIYNKRTIAVLELASAGKLKEGAREYINNIHDQLAIGLSNANAFLQLKNLVGELKALNEDYHKQNEQITDQNKRLLELHKELQEKAEELELQREKAIDAAMHKSQFLASMSHELKTPLNSILGLSELVLNDRFTSQPSKEKLEIVLRNGNRLMNLINDILNFSKLEAGKMELQTESFRISELISDIDTQILPLLKNKAIKFRTTDETGSHRPVITDKFKINQILINLLSNAVKFTEAGEIELKISVINNNELKFEVRDTGIGIAEKDKELIFEEFRQVDGSSKRKYNGTGLGLAISRRYAELLNGRLECESKPERGSTFSLIIPFEFGPEETPEVLEKAASENKESAEGEYRKSVLVIDSSTEHHSIIRNYLATKNYDVSAAQSLEEGYRRALELRPFVIILNAAVNGENSWKLLMDLKKSEEVREIPVVLITIIDELNTGYGLQVYDYILKPFDKDLLSNMIYKLQITLQKKIESIAYIGTESQDNILFEEAFSDSACKINYINDASAAFKTLCRTKPGMILLDLAMPKSDGISLLKKLKDAVETKDIPVVLCFTESQVENEMHLLNNNIEKAAIKSKCHPIDVLKVIKDRIHLEEGLPYEDISKIWLETKTESVPTQEAEPEEEESGSFSKNKVLIVDDDADTLFTVSEIVRQTGCETVLARNGVECLSVLQQYTPDLILLDIMMPQMDGFETVKRIKADINFADVPVYALTALAMIDEKEILIRNGFDDLIPKPVNPGALISKIAATLSKRTANID